MLTSITSVLCAAAMLAPTCFAAPVRVTTVDDSVDRSFVEYSCVVKATDTRTGGVSDRNLHYHYDCNVAQINDEDYLDGLADDLLVEMQGAASEMTNGNYTITDGLIVEDVGRYRVFDNRTYEMRSLSGGDVNDDSTTDRYLYISGDYGKERYYTCTLEVSYESPEPGPEPEVPHDGYEGERVTSDLTIIGEADFYINDSFMINSVSGENQTVDYTYDGSGNVDFYIASFINARYTSFKINGTEYYGQLPTPDTAEGRQAILDACKGQLNEYKLTVPFSENGYVVEASQKFLDDSDADYMMVGNFLWSYTDASHIDDYIGHGRMELVKMEFGGETYLPEDLINPGTAFDWEDDENGGSAVLPVGAVVTVRLVPEYGYQLTGFGINGGSFGTGDEQSTFTFEIRRGNAHLGASFTSVDDKVSATADTVTGGSIEIGAGEIDTGTVVLSVDDAGTLTDQQVSGFETAADGYKVSAYLDINLNQVVYKGTDDADNAWKNELSELENEAIITLALGEGVDGNEFVIIHEKHDGSYEVIPVEYDKETNTITFRTSSFSNYAVASKGGSANSDNSEAPDTGDSNSLFVMTVILTACTSVVAVTVYSKKRKGF